MCVYLHLPGTKPLGFARYFNKSILAYFLKKEKHGILGLTHFLNFSSLARFWINAQYPKAQRVAVANNWPKKKCFETRNF
ncbi:MAG: hypothetical protein US57_C0008G0010 [Candidatus Moranbacteria bacterium GW2011_GWC2_37_73]|nr:MAG: hypothetical protein UR95_C0001G0102 [Parcubacteria group bacterium GW2011_GWC1_36_108]KKQ00085.1 MAG: hypothetical protein US09_C0021G0005 [Candidatus Moranbacteria bacterium GW2011_GWD1_36_198]KKQ00136.1 MAG: hypothetical protein US10_C0040G0004 [Candidatus Moranbacteria bacterium GW2011_GWD2_36_198]KKQ39826.1 MAG: hypothetical protein US57_C0008G0010 [Candidatus Moranbacteria bacterium GW2011_GWC2_37_73]HAR99872.1 hypothetical protein [Candidatus Moranbacteria bacterium]